MPRTARWLAPIVFAVSSCQTLQPPPEIRLPVTLEAIFDTCERGDGTLVLKVERDNESVGSLTFDWVAAGPNWTVEAFNPLGQTTLAVRYLNSSQTVQASGLLVEHVPNLAIDSEGFLLVDGHFVPILATEIACFLKFRVPAAWKASLYAYEKKDDAVHLTFHERRRDADVEYVGATTLKNRALCVSMRWSRLLGLMRSSVQVCSQIDPPETAELKGLRDYAIRWSSQEN